MFLGFVFGDSLPVLIFSEVFSDDIKTGDIKLDKIRPGDSELSTA